MEVLSLEKEGEEIAGAGECETSFHSRKKGKK